MKNLFLSISIMALGYGCSFAQQAPDSQKKENKKMEKDTTTKSPVYNRNDANKVNLSNEDWKKVLSPEAYYVARQKGTERPYTSKFEGFKEKGTYYCAACGNPLFISDTKFESGCGWPSFYEPISKTSIINTPDNGANRSTMRTLRSPPWTCI
jgi:peptide-methionine (R)-S-oxide reductase